MFGTCVLRRARSTKSRSTARRNASVSWAVSCAGHGTKGAIGPEAAVGGNHMNVRVPVRERAVRLDAADETHRERGLSGQGADRGGDRVGGHAGEITEEGPAVEAPGAPALRHREHDLAVRHTGHQERLLQPQSPEREVLGVAAGAEVARLAGKREQVHVRAGVTAHAREAVREHAAGKERVGDFTDDGAPVAVRGAKRSSYAS